jgi:putative oxidoreductase
MSLAARFRSLPVHLDASTSLGLLVLRVGAGLTMALMHGLPKVGRLFGAAPIKFADPFGLGAPVSLALASFGEFVCGVLVALGLCTRAATLPLAFTMLVAVFHAHAGDPWGKREPAFMFLVAALALFFAGPGRYSFDALIRRRKAAQKT